MMEAVPPMRLEKDEVMLRTTLVSTVVISIILSGCVHTGKPSSAKTAATTSNKAGTKSPQPSENQIESSENTQNPPATTENIANFVKRHAVGATGFVDSDHQFLTNLTQQPDPGSLEEAALALGVIRSVINPPATPRPTFEEQDITFGANQTSSSSLSLEAQAQARSLDLPRALRDNPFLSSTSVARQVVEALKLYPVSEEFKAQVQSALRQQSEQWAALSPQLGSSPVETAPVSEVQPTPMADDVPLNPADLKSGDSTLAEAQSLADRGEYKAAIKKAKTLPTTSPMHATALNKIQEFSNRGVQELRRKAAEAFQNAAPLSDPRARRSYLLKAKAHLEEALNDYPDASVLATVRDNLRMISRDLEQIAVERR